MTIRALTKSLSEKNSCRPRGRLTGGGGVGICSTSQSKLTRMLPWVSISVPPEYEVWPLKYFRGSRAQVKTSARLSHESWLLSIYDHVSPNYCVLLACGERSTTASPPSVFTLLPFAPSFRSSLLGIRVHKCMLLF